MSNEITLTEEEKEIVRRIYPRLKDEEYQHAFNMIVFFDCAEKGGTPHILLFLKQNGIDLWHKIKEIPRASFWNHEELKEITIPINITYIEDRAFFGCTLKIKYDGTMEQWNAIDKDEGWHSGLKCNAVECSDGSIPIKD